MNECAGSRSIGLAFPYRSRGRTMHLVICPECGREFRRPGATEGSAPVPPHGNGRSPGARYAVVAFLALIAAVLLLVHLNNGMTPRECHEARTYAETAEQLADVMRECGN